ncbi:hypothetical protein [Paenibacillus sp. L3-i20]|uniref:hypothetical protein n=1 Tax=Paenibacillus sp. L3-i20 TaxID=2905833 RepID=UPI001EDD9573|nr:hypothetical protein [Paenibacillus sp. L3-i20]GKU77627.1 hypothetical protein L3i20_v220240 [Paenibacillus sp. L3-i20]
MLHVFGRKVLSTYIAAFALVVGIPLISMLPVFGEVYQIDKFLSWISISGLVAFPVILIYGSLISVALEFGLPKLMTKRWPLIITQGIGHVVFGALFALLIDVNWFIYVTAATSFVYFLIDQLLIRIETNRHRKKVWLALVISPIVITIVTAALLPPPAPPAALLPFTKVNALAYVTAEDRPGDGYPNYVGETIIEIDGYSVTRVTRVSELGEEKYEVLFIERWNKGESDGERWFSYVVSRYGLEAKGSGGDTAPFS